MHGGAADFNRYNAVLMSVRVVRYLYQLHELKLIEGRAASHSPVIYCRFRKIGNFLTPDKIP